MSYLTPVLAAASPVPSFVVDGETYLLRFNLSALAEFKTVTGTNLSREGVDLFDPVLFRSALRCALLWNRPSITEQVVGSLVDLDNMAAVRECLYEAITGSRPVPAPVDADETAVTENPPSA